MLKILINITAAVTASAFLILAAKVALADTRDTISIRFAQVECPTRGAQNLAQLIEIIMTCDEQDEARKKDEASLRNSLAKGN